MRRIEKNFKEELSIHKYYIVTYIFMCEECRGIVGFDNHYGTICRGDITFSNMVLKSDRHEENDLEGYIESVLADDANSVHEFTDLVKAIEYMLYRE